VWWGHQLKKQPGTIWLILQNVDGIPTHTDGDLKLDCLYQLMTEYQVDILTLTKLNTAWDKLPYEAWLPQKTCGWWEASHWSMSHNKKDKHGDGLQPGSIAILVINEWVHQVTKPGDNTSGLSCWSWIRLRRQENHHLCIVTLYHACKSNGHLKTYQQQVQGQTGNSCNLCKTNTH